MKKTESSNAQPAPCASCGGSGQFSYFRGISRFVMDWDECPDCLGTGLTQPREKNKGKTIPPATSGASEDD